MLLGIPLAMLLGMASGPPSRNASRDAPGHASRNASMNAPMYPSRNPYGEQSMNLGHLGPSRPVGGDGQSRPV